MSGPYLLIAHKPDSSDYCRGCLMANYPGDFEIENHLSTEELEEHLIRYLLRNKDLGCNEAGYDMYVFKNGIQIIRQGQAWVDLYNYYEDENWEELDKKIEELSAEGYEIIQRVKERAEKKFEELENQKELKRREAKVKRDNSEREVRKQQYQKLKEEFENEV